MKAQVTYIEQPLKNMALQGLHLIEASAGTGKTWTLSSLMVRILTEKYMPRQVIATTFTRAAAAELKSRIRLRLQDMQRQTALWADLDPSQYADTLANLKDPLEQVLFDRFQHYDDQLEGLSYLNNRLKLVIDSLDELFVGTIDSFTQKLLREFSFESGEVIPRQMTEKEKQYPYQIVHDVLRAWLNQQPQEVVDLLLLSKSLKDTDDYVKTVVTTLNFSQAKIQEIQEPKIDLQGFKQHVQYFLEYIQSGAIKNLEEYYLPTGSRAKYISGTYFKGESFYILFTRVIPKVAQLVSQHGTNLFFSPMFTLLLDDLFSLFVSKSNGNLRENIFKKCDISVVTDFYQHPLIICLKEIYDGTMQYQEGLSVLDHYLRYYLSIEVKKRLPQELLQAGETTFNQQTRTLREALEGEKGQQFAQAVVQRYPIILVDEFQDTNQEQDNILKTIWRDATRLNQSCFIAVGDPKQAIYGFRGGDILTYINAFNDIAAKQGKFYRLMHNFRSVANLVDVVDQLFHRQINFGEGIDYYHASSGNKDLQPLLHHGKPDLQPLKLVNIAPDYNEEYIIARKIRGLLIQGQKGQLSYIEEQQPQPIRPEDIAVLASSQRELDLVQKQLEKINIQVNRATLTSVFTSTAAQDIGAILQAIVQPEQEPKLKRALLTSAIGLTLTDFQNFELHADELSQHIHNFRYARQIWLSKGFLLAWQWLSDHYQIWQKLAKHEGEQAERTIVNTRHLIELLSQHSYQYQGIQHLLHWYQIQLSSPQQRDWELERKLSSAAGVQLMTIHKSKGLEFKIVFLMDAAKAIDLTRTKAGELGFFEQGDAHQPERVIAISPSLIKDNDQAYQKHIEKKLAENHRLWYVALTRASYAIYLMCKEKKLGSNHSLGGVDFWLKAQDEAFEHVGFTIDESKLIQADYQPDQLEHLKLQAIAYPKQAFYPKSRTSFSYLASHKTMQRTVDALAEYSHVEQGANDEQDKVQINTLMTPEQTQALSWIQNNFPKGAQAGNCLHDLLEDIDFQNSQLWDKEIQRKLSSSGMWTALLNQAPNALAEDFDIEQTKKDLREQMKIWLEQILNTPIHPLAEKWLCLKDLSRDHRMAEFDFYLSLADQRFMSDRIHQLFASYGYEMPEFEQANTARYLNGAIDLTYFDGQRFHIADYKSNYLGDVLGYYVPENIAVSMTSSSYWLQAGIYLVALHRHLQSALQGYDPKQHLGGASYLYLRGMHGQQGYGVQHWQAPLDLILALDELLGQHLLTKTA